jgi:hypothetical protein
MLATATNTAGDCLARIVQNGEPQSPCVLEAGGGITRDGANLSAATT